VSGGLSLARWLAGRARCGTDGNKTSGIVAACDDAMCREVWCEGVAMNILVPFDNSDLARRALHEACRIAMPHDRMIVMAAVIVPEHLPVDVSTADVWERARAAGRCLREAHREVVRSADGVACQFVRVHARDHVAAIVAGATNYEADTILIAQWATKRRLHATLFGDLEKLLRVVPCDVRVLCVVPEERVSPYLRDPYAPDNVVQLSHPYQQPHPIAFCESVTALEIPANGEPWDGFAEWERAS
jgi:nucleotide-binding universal stress UspA family protein